ncbi:hypothetical protein [Altericroceibacterium xinjiangense]|uniref:hypothetical protein n=1 Tax=Altericroceibacterium xinjiangense TaxID=762261 RepID=UPI000F7F78BD|nr:hypothetical protein [Altericroceibacterium xinjiangense]
MRNMFALLAAGGLALGLSACDVDQTEEGAAPEIDVDAGSMPEYDVEPVDVDVSSGTRTVEVPTMDVDANIPDAEGEPVTPPSE